MNRIGLSFYAVFVVAVAFAIATIATLAQNFAPETKSFVAAETRTSATLNSERGKKGDTASAHTRASAEPAGKAKPAEKAEQATEPAHAVENEQAREAPPTTETAFRAKVAALVEPLVKLSIPDADLKALGSARQALRKGDLEAARKIASEVKLTATRHLIVWTILRSGYGRPQDYRAFLKANPLWPDRKLIRRRLEQSLFIDGGSARQILAQFKGKPPSSDAGLAAVASAHLALGDKGEARKYAAKAWCGGGIAARREEAFLKRFGALLTNADHTCRLNTLLVDNLRWTSARKRRAHAVRRVIKLLDEKDRKKATARLAAFLRQRVATKWLAAVPAAQRSGDWGYAFQNIQHLRRRDKDTEAWKLLGKVPTDPAKITNPDAWWEERHANALNAVRAKKAKLAYGFVEDIRPSDINAAKEQAFFAGWVALRKLGQPKAALEHFKRMLSLVDGPLSSSKAHYWLGRTHAALGNDSAAARHYKAGGQFRDTFHGLLAMQTHAPDARNLALPLPGVPDTETAKRFIESEAVRAAVIAHRAELPRGHVLKFFRALAKGLPGEPEVVLLAQLANALGDGQLEVRTGKTGIARGYNLYIYSYPVGHLPTYEPLRRPPEKALVLAIARQESEFNTRIVSGAGARGILQVMPITAKHICRQYKIKCNLSDLIAKPEYNARIATAYLADRTEEFAGSYILTFTGYNAGPGRTREWLRRIGDPRGAKHEPLDWIYAIPFEETRLYVQKVLSNLQVYRARLGDKQPLRLLDDMNRGRKKS